MDEYIDKQELLSVLEKKIKADNERRMAVVDRDFIDLVNEATVISDMVEVVRCKDCRHFNDEDEYCPVLGFCEPDEYCSRSERRKEDG